MRDISGVRRASFARRSRRDVSRFGPGVGGGQQRRGMSHRHAISSAMGHWYNSRYNNVLHSTYGPKSPPCPTVGHYGTKRDMLGISTRRKVGCRLNLLRWPVTRPARLRGCRMHFSKSTIGLRPHRPRPGGRKNMSLHLDAPLRIPITRIIVATG